MGFRLFVGNLPYDTTEDEIRDHFSPVGQLSYVSIPLDRETGKKGGLDSSDLAEPAKPGTAFANFNIHPLKERPLAETEPRRRETGRRLETGSCPNRGFRPAPP